MVTWREGVTRAWRRPRAWLLVYGLVSLPAALVGPLLALTLLPLVRLPLFNTALATRRLDFVTDLLLGPLLKANLDIPTPDIGTPVLGGLLGICGVLLVWPLFGLVWVFLEGGTLTSYAAAQPVTWREFWAGCKRWFGPFLVLNSVGVILAGLALVAGLGVAYGLSGRLPVTAQVVRGLGWLLAGGIASWVELMRVTAVVREVRQVGNWIRLTAQVVKAHALDIAQLLLGSVALYALLGWAYRLVMDRLPFRWWLATLLIQQLYVLLRLGVRLAREAGMVGNAR